MTKVVMNHFPLFREFMDMFEEELTVLSGNNGKYHLERNVLYHTLMVYQASVLTGNKLFPFVGLAHDIGKKRATKYIDDKLRMTGHEGTSTILALEFLKEYRDEMMELFSRDEILKMLYIINYHGALWQKSTKQIEKNFAMNEDLLKLIKDFNLCDKSGNISIDKHIEKEFLVKAKENVNLKDATIYILMGLPGSGKSTYINKNYPNLEVLSRDDILENYGEDKFGSDLSYNEIWKLLDDEDQKEIDRLLQKRFTALKRSGKDFIIDMTNLGWKTRRKWYSDSHNTIIKCFLEPFSVVKERNEKRVGKTINEKIINSMSERLELPLIGEHKSIIDIEVLF